jgi:hypothetical protein
MNIPIIINNRDRVTPLSQLILWFKKRDHHNITVLDNASSYPPLLKYYRSMKDTIKIVYLAENQGSKAPWVQPELQDLAKPPFIYSYPDVIPSPECPDDLIPFLVKVLNKYGTHKAAPALRIDDIPDHYSQKERVLNWESQMWTPDGEVDGVPMYRAGVDTTLALYSEWGEIDYDAIRTGAPYWAAHLPWYVDSKHPSKEDTYYSVHANQLWHHWGFDDCYPSRMRDFEKP